ncbi:TAXI family TRAP transporter solute-binding subunit [Rhodobacter sp. NTK016B]|uniref:TAXI family TRAP transporter solute-binding subunit n=1 Tax=Rhodobacter sp. NTK016B TaxID=2759676 RepID=UPI001A8D0242|nr:TAXI family TRAP transporter solute-binding subunit [Rhodobacter sp. NTK016B]MBN8293294.1 TAXI family TRAP transporter solute-binding subunit [Rhodobacter sp. NTK016B]
MTMKNLIAAAGLALLGAAPVAAQPLGIGTMGQGTSGYSMGAAIASVFAANGVDALVQPSTGTSAFLPLIDAGELDFGIVNALEIGEATAGQYAFEGRPLNNLRMAARLFPFRVGVFVRDDSPVQSVADLAGQRVTYGFTAQVTLNRVLDALMATGEVGADDIEQVLVPNVVRGADDFAAGNADAAFFAMGSGKVSEVDAAVGGVRFLPVSMDEDAIARMQAIVPQAYVQTVEPAANLTGVDEAMGVMSYDYVLIVGAHVPDDVVEQAITVLHDNQAALAEAFANFSTMDPDAMYADIGVAWHDGALDAYRAMGQVD